MSGTEQTLAVSGAETGPRPDLGDRLAAGVLVGRYVVLGQLGSGGMGVVYAAYDPELDRKVAVKLLHTRASGDSPASTGYGPLLREAQAMAKLSHPGVVTVHDVGEHEGRVYLAMEFIEGETLGGWLRRRARGWSEIVASFHAAGLGLAAAHAQGLVHRDFKPENVMVGADGRVSVMDFGLARRSGGGTNANTDREFASAPSSDDLAPPPTQQGSVAGTPAYMAPEQHTGHEVGPAADQFAFCVALYEALYGQRPFGGDNLVALAFNVTQGRLRAPPPGKRVPGWLRRVCLRGLAVEPERRFVSMDELLVQLSRGRARTKLRRVSLGVAAVVVVALGALALRRYDAAQRVAACEADGATILESWNDETRARLRDGLTGTGVSYSATTVEKLLPYFDAQARAWTHARTQACLDARVRTQWDEDLLDRAVWCLEERRLELEALTTELARADATALRSAVSAAAALLPVDVCRDAARLRRMPRPPQAQEQMQAVRRTLSRAKALAAAGRYGEGLEATSQALAAAETLDWAPLSAAVRAENGAMLDKQGRHAEAEVVLEQAYFDAAAHGAPEVAAEASISLVYNVGAKQSRAAEGRRWARHAEVQLEGLGERADGLRRAAALNNLANLERAAGAYAEAQALHERALAIKEKVLGSEHPDVASSLNNLAVVHYTRGAYREAEELYERALAIREQALGADHPDVGNSLNNLALLHRATGAYAEAKTLHERALAIRQQALGPEHPEVATSLNNLANVHEAMGAYPEAQRLHERSLAIAEKVLGPEHPDVAQTLNNLALVHQAIGDHAQARVLSERALAIKEKALGPDHPDLASSLNNLADAHRGLGAHEHAKALYERALAIREKALGPDHPRLAYSLNGLAEVALAQRRPTEAVALAQRAVQVREQGDAPAEELAESRFVLAKALWIAPAGEGGDRERSRALALAVRDLLRDRKVPGPSLLEVQRWLEQHTPP